MSSLGSVETAVSASSMPSRRSSRLELAESATAAPTSASSGACSSQVAAEEFLVRLGARLDPHALAPGPSGTGESIVFRRAGVFEVVHYTFQIARRVAALTANWVSSSVREPP